MKKEWPNTQHPMRHQIKKRTIMPAKHEVTPENIALVSRMYAVGVIKEDLAPMIGLSCVKTLNEHYGDYMVKSKVIVVDDVCGHLMKLIKKGNFQAIKFYLQCQAGWRTEEKTEVAIVAERIDTVKVELVSLDEHEEGE